MTIFPSLSRSSGKDVFVQPFLVKDLNLTDADRVNGWALKGLKPNSSEIYWKALLLELCPRTSADVGE